MKLLLSIAIMIVGVALIGWALFSPLVTIPVVGSVGFAKAYFGGKALAWTIIGLLAVATFFLGCPRTSAPALGWFLAGGAMGLLAATLLAIYRGLLDQIQQLSDAGGQADVQLLLDKAEAGKGMIALGAGLVIWLGAVCFAYFGSERRGDNKNAQQGN